MNPVIIAAQQFLNNGNESQAASLLKFNKLDKQYQIRNGRIVDITDQSEDWLDKFITVDPQMLELKEDARKLSHVNDEVLICGPTGTGKELIARALHGKRTGKFKAVNCAGLPEHLIESELFGHVRGAFTGAMSDQEGLMKLASSESDAYGPGTFFLDEVGELPLAAQGKLLRALQEKTIRKVGGKEDIEIDCRVIAATNKSIPDMCNEGKFRIDLYARLAVFELHTTSLEERSCDIASIAKSLPDGDAWLKAVTGRKIILPFNVRSLQSEIRRYKVLGRTSV